MTLGELLAIIDDTKKRTGAGPRYHLQPLADFVLLGILFKLPQKELTRAVRSLLHWERMRCWAWMSCSLIALTATVLILSRVDDSAIARASIVVVFIARQKTFHMLGGNQFDLMAQLEELPRPEICAPSRCSKRVCWRNILTPDDAVTFFCCAP